MDRFLLPYAHFLAAIVLESKPLAAELIWRRPASWTKPNLARRMRILIGYALCGGIICSGPQALLEAAMLRPTLWRKKKKYIPGLRATPADELWRMTNLLFCIPDTAFGPSLCSSRYSKMPGSDSPVLDRTWRQLSTARDLARHTGGKQETISRWMGSGKTTSRQNRSSAFCRSCFEVRWICAAVRTAALPANPR